MEFIDDDQGFLGWKETHVDGFVLNTSRRPRADYLMLHRATCPHLRRPDPDVHWTKSFIKICSTQVDDLVRWANQHLPGQPQLRPCKWCKP